MNLSDRRQRKAAERQAEDERQRAGLQASLEKERLRREQHGDPVPVPAEDREYLAAKGRAEFARNVRNTKDLRLSEFGDRTAAGLACPRCGGAQFKARRTKAARVGIVVTGLAAAAVTKQKRVQCVTCGAQYDRG